MDEKQGFPIISIDKWNKDPEFGIYPHGARDKSLFISPETPQYDFIRPSFRYLFKKSNKRYPEQFWIEIIAYHLGILLGVPVPKAMPAVYEEENGALIEWFLMDASENVVLGGELMRYEFEHYDLKLGKNHNLETVLQICGNENPQYWAKVLCFDALTGNSDRHHDNWGIIYSEEGSRISKVRFTPAFDNGTAMGHEIVEHKMYLFSPSYLDKYIERGQHHMKWSKDDDMSKLKGEGHFSMLEKFCKSFPETKDIMLAIIPDEDIFTALKVILDHYASLDLTVKLSTVRIEFIMKLLRARASKMKAVLTQ